jgi:AcrR family transcriptional regulator
MSSTDTRPTRRERVRHETLAELRAAALDEVREHGAVALSLRRVARRMGMSPAGLYRYVESREHLLTLLIAEGYDDLADALERALAAAPPQDLPARLHAVGTAYRRWAVEHPNEFGLLFGDPIPGYAAPEGGVTVEAMTRVGQALATPVLEAWQQERLRSHPALEAPALAGPLAALDALGGPLPSAIAARLLLTWGRLHGQVSLEVFGHHTWAFPDGCEALFDAELAVMADDLLLPAP